MTCHSCCVCGFNLFLSAFMRQREGALADEDSVDMDGENGRGFEEYEWAGQKRIRATALLEGGFRGTNTQASCCSVLVVFRTGQSTLLVL